MTPAESLVPPEFVRACLRLDADAGLLYWLRRPREHFSTNKGFLAANEHAGEVAGETGGRYSTVHFRCNGQKFKMLTHRVVWVLHTGAWPEQVIDHINRVRRDNRPCNLRDVAPDENLRNNGNPRRTGLLGAYPSGDKFMSHIQAPHPYRYLGTFDTALEAHQAYVAAVAEFNATGVPQ